MATMVTACSTKTMDVDSDHVDVYVYVGSTLSPKLTDAGTNKVSYQDKTLHVDVASNVTEVEFDLQAFFTANPKFKGKNFYFTRSDVKKGDGTLIKGYGWTQVGGEAGSRLYKKFGHEQNESIEEMTKEQIAALPNREGEARMYAITTGTQAGKHLLYIDPSTGSQVETGETAVTFRLHGHHGKTAVLKVKVIKA